MKIYRQIKIKINEGKIQKYKMPIIAPDSIKLGATLKSDCAQPCLKSWWLPIVNTRKQKALQTMMPTGPMPSPVTGTCLSHAPATEHCSLYHFTLTSSAPAITTARKDFFTTQHTWTSLSFKNQLLSIAQWKLPWFPQVSWMALSIVFCLTVLHVWLLL